MNENLYYLDNSIMNNPNLSKTANTINKIATPIVGALYLFFILYHLIKNNDFSKIPYFIHATIFFSIIIVQYILHKKYGRKFIKLTKQLLILKNNYFEKSISIPWNLIDKIRFVEKKFIIETNDSILKEVKFNAPLNRYLDIRKDIKGYITNHKINIIE